MHMDYEVLRMFSEMLALFSSLATWKNANCQLKIYAWRFLARGLLNDGSKLSSTNADGEIKSGTYVASEYIRSLSKQVVEHRTSAHLESVPPHMDIALAMCCCPIMLSFDVI